jgi:hypothetical protein
MLTPLEEEDGYELLQQQPTHQPSPFTTSDANHDKTPSLASGSTVPAPPLGVDPASGCGSGSSHKRKTPSSPPSGSRKKADYWHVDERTGRHFHLHKDGTVTWRD